MLCDLSFKLLLIECPDFMERGGAGYQLAWPQLETQLGQNSAWAKATTAFIFMCVVLGKRTFS